MEKKTKDMLISALISGGAIVVMSNTPYLSYINYVCCLGVLAGGFAGTLYYKTKQKITPKDGALIGLFGGLLAGLLNTIITVAAFAYGGAALTALLATLGLAWAPIVFMIVSVILGFVIYAAFGTVGGLIGGAIFQKGK